LEDKRSPQERIRCSVVSNGTLLDKKTTGFFVSHGIELQLSFDGVSQAQDVRGKGTFSTLDNLLEVIRNEHPDWYREKLSVSITLSSVAVPYLAESVEYLVDKSVRQIGIGPVFTHDTSWEIHHIDVLDRQFDRIFTLSEQHYSQTGEIPVVDLRRTLSGPSRPFQDRFMCAAASGKTITVDVDGQVYGCVAFARSSQEIPPSCLASQWDRARLGDLRDPCFLQSLANYPKRVRAGSIFTDKVKKYSSYLRCKECPYLRSCVICPASITHLPGNADPHRVSDLQCAYQRVSLQYKDRFPAQVSARDVLKESARVTEFAKKVREAVLSESGI
jgi:radical SAM protein with 4Fe4S-binding SPASM domain